MVELFSDGGGLEISWKISSSSFHKLLEKWQKKQKKCYEEIQRNIFFKSALQQWYSERRVHRGVIPKIKYRKCWSPSKQAKNTTNNYRVRRWVLEPDIWEYNISEPIIALFHASNLEASEEHVSELNASKSKVIKI